MNSPGEEREAVDPDASQMRDHALREREKEKKLRRKSKMEKVEVEYALRDQFPLIPPFDIEDHIGLSLIRPRLS